MRWKFLACQWYLSGQKSHFFRQISAAQYWGILLPFKWSSLNSGFLTGQLIYVLNCVDRHDYHSPENGLVYRLTYNVGKKKSSNENSKKKMRKVEKLRFFRIRWFRYRNLARSQENSLFLNKQTLTWNSIIYSQYASCRIHICGILLDTHISRCAILRLAMNSFSSEHKPRKRKSIL